METPLPATLAPLATSDWREGLPALVTATLTLRELRLTDAMSLLTLLTTEEVTRFISPPPTTVEGFERFILWTQRERAAGNYISFGVVPAGSDTAIGLFQIRKLEPEFATAEWGFALGSQVPGQGHLCRRRPARHGLRVRHHGGASARSSGRRAERPRQRRPSEDRRNA